MIGGTRRGRNLQEMLSPTVQSGDTPGDGNDDDGPGGGGGSDDGRWNGSYHCNKHKERSNCDVCSYMNETSYVTSYYFKRRFAIHGRNIHLPAAQKNKKRWFIYLMHDTDCQLLYVGSTTDVCKRFANAKSACLGRKSSSTGLYKHFLEGCPTHLQTGDMRHVTITLLDHMDTSQEKLEDAGHTGGVQCRCGECEKLKDLEDKWICRLGSFHAPHGINTRDEIKARSRVNFLG